MAKQDFLSTLRARILSHRRSEDSLEIQLTAACVVTKYALPFSVMAGRTLHRLSCRNTRLSSSLALYKNGIRSWNMAASADILVVIAHPDDAEFGVAGTVARWVLEGKQVVYVVCTSGEKGTSDRTMKPGLLAQIREREQEAAARVLGVR